MTGLMDTIRIPDLMRIIKTLSPLMNPFSLLSLAISSSQINFTPAGYDKLIAANMVINFILAIQAAIALGLRFLRRAEGQKVKRWLWRDRFLFENQRLSYCEPNGYLLIELLQLAGCSSLAIYYGFVYHIARNSRISFLSFSTSALWYTLCHLPAFLGCWFTSWSALYFVLLCPQRDQRSNPSSRRDRVWDPIAMNTLCLGIPVLLVMFFSTLGIIASITSHELVEQYGFLKTNLAELKSRWSPSQSIDEETIEKLSRLLENLKPTVKRLIRIYQVIALSWAIISLLLLCFYSITMTCTRKIIKRTFEVAAGKTPLVKVELEHELSFNKKLRVGSLPSMNKTVPQSDQSAPVFSISLPELLMEKAPNPTFASQLKRHYYFLNVSSIFMVTSLVCNLSFAVLLALRMEHGIDKKTGNSMFALSTSSSLLSSLCLLLQSVICRIVQ